MKSHPAGLRRPTNIIACSWEGASQLRWCGVGLAALGWVEKARVSRPGSKGRWGPLGVAGGGFALRVFAGWLRGDEGGFGVIF